MERQHVINNLSYQAQKDGDGKRWKIEDLYTGKFLIITVSIAGEISFRTNEFSFHYAEALLGLVQLEERKLSIRIPNKMRKFKETIESMDNVTKVPCSGVRFQLYYLNP